MIDLERQLGVVLAQRVVREFGQMHHRVVTAQVIRRDLPNVLLLAPGRLPHAVIQHPIAVKTRVEAGHVVPGTRQLSREQDADVTIRSCDEQFHSVVVSGSTRDHSQPVVWVVAVDEVRGVDDDRRGFTDKLPVMVLSTPQISGSARQAARKLATKRLSCGLAALLTPLGRVHEL